MSGFETTTTQQPREVGPAATARSRIVPHISNNLSRTWMHACGVTRRSQKRFNRQQGSPHLQTRLDPTQRNDFILLQQRFGSSYSPIPASTSRGWLRKQLRQRSRWHFCSNGRLVAWKAKHCPKCQHVTQNSRYKALAGLVTDGQKGEHEAASWHNSTFEIKAELQYWCKQEQQNLLPEPKKNSNNTTNKLKITLFQTREVLWWRTGVPL